MRRLLVILALVTLAGAAPAALPWIRDMWTGPVVRPQTESRPMPARSIAVDGRRPLNRRQARDLVNPLAATDEVLADGAEQFRVYCVPCHGTGGHGDGPLASFYRRMPDLTPRYVRNYPDGFLYAIIRTGGREMPRFGDALSIEERWAVVHHLRTLEPRFQAEPVDRAAADAVRSRP